VLIGKGNGVFNVPKHTSLGASPVSVAVSDLDGDGLDDAATGNGWSGTVSVLINAGDFPAANAPSVTIGNIPISEGNIGTKVASLTVTLSANPTEVIQVNYATADGSATTGNSDYVAKVGTLTFTPGGSLTQTVDVTVNGDRRGELNETFLVNLSGAPNAFLIGTQGVATITDDEPRLTVTDARISEGNRGTKLMSFVVTLSFAYDAPVTVTFATSDGSGMVANNDYVPKSATLTFRPGESLTQTITITIVADRRREPNETLFVTLSNADGAYIEDALGVGTIVNDDKGGGRKNR
jgi:hypothetical protein